MNEQLDREFMVAVEGWLEEDGPAVAPDRLVDQILVGFPKEQRQAEPAWPRFAIVALAASLATLLIVTAALIAARPPVGPPSIPSTQHCPAATPACGNVLDAGITYTSASFEQPVTFIVPRAIWAATTDEPWGFRMQVDTDPRLSIGLYNAPGATDSRGQRLAGADTSAAALIAAWRVNPEIAVGPTRTTTLLGAPATYVDIQSSKAATTVADACGEDLIGFFCMPLLEAKAGELRSDMYVAYVGHYRIYLLEHGGALVAVTLEAKHEGSFAQLQQLADPVLANLRFAR